MPRPVPMAPSVAAAPVGEYSGFMLHIQINL